MVADLRRPRRDRRVRRVLRSAVASIALAAWLVALVVAPAAAATPYSRDLYFSAGYEHQIDGKSCTAASVAMMMNFIARRDLNLNQSTILAYEKPRDALPDATQHGSDPLGWSRGATYYSSTTGLPTTYRWEAYSTAAAAIRRAASQLAITSKPVGFLVSHGTHAMVMTGFTASVNPARRTSFVMSTVWLSDPNGAHHVEYSAWATPLNTYLQLDATSTYDALWYGKYVIVVPLD